MNHPKNKYKCSRKYCYWGTNSYDEYLNHYNEHTEHYANRRPSYRRLVENRVNVCESNIYMSQPIIDTSINDKGRGNVMKTVQVPKTFKYIAPKVQIERAEEYDDLSRMEPWVYVLWKFSNDVEKQINWICSRGTFK